MVVNVNIMNNGQFRLARPIECSICKTIFNTPRDLIQHFNSSHHNNTPSGFAAFQSPPATSTGPTPSPFRLCANQSPNPPASHQARNRFDVNTYFGRGYLDEQGGYHRGPDPAVSKTDVSFTKNNKRPRLVAFSPGASSSSSSSDGGRTLPLLRQLEMQMQEETVRENRRVGKGYIDLTLRLGLP